MNRLDQLEENWLATEIRSQRQDIDELKRYAGIVTAGVVNSVFGRTGVVTAQAGDYTWAQIDKSGSSLSDIVTRTHALLTGLSADDHPQYHNDARALTWLGTRSTADLSEGSNLYYTNARADGRIAAAVGVSVQAYSANLAAIAGLTTAANKVTYWTGSGTAATTDLTAAGRTVIGGASVNAILNSILPSQTGNANKYLQTDGTNTSWVTVSSGVSSVFGRTGAVVAATNDYTWAQIDKSASSIADLTTKTHSLLSGLSSDDHTQYALLAGRSGGQTLIGGTASANDLTLQSTSNATKGKIKMGTSYYHETLNQLYILSSSGPSLNLTKLASLASGDTLGLIGFGGEDDAANINNAQGYIAAIATQTWLQTGNKRGTRLEFGTTPTDGNVPVTRLTIGQDGALTVANLGTGIVHASSAGLLTSSAVNLAGSDVTGLLPNANLANASLTIGSTSVSLGGTAATIAGLTLTTPTIASFTNAQHTHQTAAQGGTLDAAAIASGVLGTARLGTGTANSGVFLRGDGTWAAAPGGVSTVFGRSGAVVAATNDYTWAQIDKTASSIGDIATRTHSLLSGLTSDDHTQYALLAGRSGGQTLIGGTASGESLTLSSTSNATKGKILFGGSTSFYDQANTRLSIGQSAPDSFLTAVFHSSGSNIVEVSATTNQPELRLNRRLGTGVTAGMAIGGVTFGAIDSAGNQDTTAFMYAYATETWTTLAHGSKIAFTTYITGSNTSVTGVTIENDGRLTASVGLTIASLSGVLKASSGVVSGGATTTDLTEGSNLYFTNARADARIAAAVGVTVQGYSANTAFRTDKLSVFAATTSAELLGVISDETGSGSLVFANSPTLTTPTIASMTNAQHNHQNAAGGGTLDAAAIATGVLAVARLGTGTPDGTKFLRDDGVFVTPPTGGSGTTIPSGALMIWTMPTAPTGWLVADGSAVSRTTYSALWAALHSSIGNPTITIATPAVLTLAAHGFNTGDLVYLTTTGALPTGLSANTAYYVIKIDANTFNLATSRANAVAGTKIATSGTQSGTHTIFLAPYGIGDGTTTFNLPNLKGSVPVGQDTTQTEFDNLGETGGEKTHTLTTAEMPSHTHQMPNTTNGGVAANPGAYLNNQYTNNAANTTAATATALGNTGGGGAHQNLQPYIAMVYIIKT